MDITNINKSSKIAIYSRKSREEGDDTLENHRLRLSEFVNKNGFTNVHWYEEVVTGSSIDMNIEQATNDVVLEINNSNGYVSCLNVYYDTTTKLFTNKELRHLPRKQYEEFTKFRKLSA